MKTKTFPAFLAISVLQALALALGLYGQTASAVAADQEKPKTEAGPAPGKTAAAAPVKKEGDWKPLFDGKTLKGWKVTDFAGAGEVKVEEGEIKLHAGLALTGINWTNTVPKTNFEVALEAMKVDGNDFFCGLTFPVNDSHCSFIVGGWGGGVVGISSIDGQDASENEATKFMNFEKGRWYRIRARVTPTKIQTWIDDEKMVDVSIVDRKISLRPGEIEDSVPLGVATYQVTAAIRDIRIRQFEAK